MDTFFQYHCNVQQEDDIDGVTVPSPLTNWSAYLVRCCSFRSRDDERNAQKDAQIQQPMASISR